jgi:hypothetical protein
VYLFGDLCGCGANHCDDVHVCETEGDCKNYEHFFASEENYYSGEIRFIFDGREEKGCDHDTKREIQNADGSDAGSHQGNSNCAGGV